MPLQLCRSFEMRIKRFPFDSEEQGDLQDALVLKRASHPLSLIASLPSFA